MRNLVKGMRVFQRFKPSHDKRTFAEPNIHIDHKKLDGIAAKYAKREEVVPKKLQQAIEEEKSQALSYNVHGEECLDDEVLQDMEELRAMYRGLPRDEEDAYESVDAVGEQIYHEAIKSVDQRHESEGMVIIKNGDNNNALGSLIQCFLVMKPMKEYLVKGKHLKLGAAKQNVGRRIITKNLAKIYK